MVSEARAPASKNIYNISKIISIIKTTKGVTIHFLLAQFVIIIKAIKKYLVILGWYSSWIDFTSFHHYIIFNTFCSLNFVKISYQLTVIQAIKPTESWKFIIMGVVLDV